MSPFLVFRVVVGLFWFKSEHHSGIDVSYWNGYTLRDRLFSPLYPADVPCARGMIDERHSAELRLRQPAVSKQHSSAARGGRVQVRRKDGTNSIAPMQAQS